MNTPSAPKASQTSPPVSFGVALKYTDTPAQNTRSKTSSSRASRRSSRRGRSHSSRRGRSHSSRRGRSSRRN